jgi:PIN domain nuclease of toxin-antitoxin system
VILLDTNAILFLLEGHRRSKVLLPFMGELRASPLSLMELQMLAEVGRLRFATKDPRDAFGDDPRWQLDDPAVGSLVRCAHDIRWTRDPFDRLLVAHAQYRRWRLATSDARILEHLPAKQVLEL